MLKMEFAEAISLGAAIGTAVYSAMSEHADRKLSDEEIAAISSAVAAEFYNSRVSDEKEGLAVKPAEQAVDASVDKPVSDAAPFLMETTHEPLVGQMAALHDGGDGSDNIAANWIDGLEMDEGLTGDSSEVSFVPMPHMPDESMFPEFVTLSNAGDAFYSSLSEVDVEKPHETDGQVKENYDERFSGSSYETIPAKEEYSEGDLQIDDVDIPSEMSFTSKFMTTSPVIEPVEEEKSRISETDSTVASVEKPPVADSPVSSDGLSRNEPRDDIAPEHSLVQQIPDIVEEPEVAVTQKVVVEKPGQAFKEIESELLEELEAHKRSFGAFVKNN